MTKLGKSCILRITSTHLYFIVRESQTISSAPLIWCTLEERHYFSEFGMDGLSPADNEIYLEFLAGMLSIFKIYNIILKQIVLAKYNKCLYLQKMLPKH